MNKNYDDLGSGKYDYMGIAKRIALHAKKAEEFLKKDDLFNARMHAMKCCELCATGMLGLNLTIKPSRSSKKLRKEIGGIRFLREQTGCRILDCYKALQECKGDGKKALALLRRR